MKILPGRARREGRGQAIPCCKFETEVRWQKSEDRGQKTEKNKFSASAAADGAVADVFFRKHKSRGYQVQDTKDGMKVVKK